jgi:hypothetical protein
MIRSSVTLIFLASFRELMHLPARLPVFAHPDSRVYLNFLHAFSITSLGRFITLDKCPGTDIHCLSQFWAKYQQTDLCQCVPAQGNLTTSGTAVENRAGVFVGGMSDGLRCLRGLRVRLLRHRKIQGWISRIWTMSEKHVSGPRMYTARSSCQFLDL